MNVYDYLKELAEKYKVKYSDNEDLVKKLVYDSYIDEIKEVDVVRENSHYMWIYKINGEFYALEGTYQSHYGTEIYDYTLQKVEKQKVTREEWVHV